MRVGVLVTSEAQHMHVADDAKLLNRVRAGDAAAFEVLAQRHRQAARLLAAELTATSPQADDLLAATFARVLAVTQRGAGPTDAFRPYLLAAVHRCWIDQNSAQTAAGQDGRDPGEVFLAPGPDAPLLAQALASLPARWIAALWHTEVEASSPAEVGAVLGLSQNGVATLRGDAKDGLRQACLHLHSERQAQCAPVTARLGAFLRDGGTGGESGLVTEHLRQCDDCRAVYAELADVSLALRTVVAPMFLGDATTAYLAAAGRGLPPAAPAPAAPAPAAIGPAAIGPPPPRLSRPQHLQRRIPPRLLSLPLPQPPLLQSPRPSMPPQLTHRPAPDPGRSRPRPGSASRTS